MSWDTFYFVWRPFKQISNSEHIWTVKILSEPFSFLILEFHMALLSLEPSFELFLWEPLSMEYIQHWRKVSSSSQTFYPLSLVFIQGIWILFSGLDIQLIHLLITHSVLVSLSLGLFTPLLVCHLFGYLFLIKLKLCTF